MEDKQTWEGTPTELLGLLEAVAPTLSINTKNQKVWPSKPNVLSRRLKYIISNLKEFGINVRHADSSTTKNKRLCIEKIIKKEGAKSSIPSIHRYDMQNHAQISDDVGIDVNNGIDVNIDTSQISIPQNYQIHAQNGSGIDSIGSIDILQDNNCYYSCYYCDDYKTNNKDHYERHVILRHDHCPAYPNKAETDKRALKPQGKDWEI
jgi:hypothetical protein